MGIDFISAFNIFPFLYPPEEASEFRIHIMSMAAAGASGAGGGRGACIIACMKLDIKFDIA